MFVEFGGGVGAAFSRLLMAGVSTFTAGATGICHFLGLPACVDNLPANLYGIIDSTDLHWKNRKNGSSDV